MDHLDTIGQQDTMEGAYYKREPNIHYLPKDWVATYCGLNADVYDEEEDVQHAATDKLRDVSCRVCLKSVDELVLVAEKMSVNGEFAYDYLTNIDDEDVLEAHRDEVTRFTDALYWLREMITERFD